MYQHSRFHRQNRVNTRLEESASINRLVCYSAGTARRSESKAAAAPWTRLIWTHPYPLTTLTTHTWCDATCGEVGLTLGAKNMGTNIKVTAQDGVLVWLMGNMVCNLMIKCIMLRRGGAMTCICWVGSEWQLLNGMVYMGWMPRPIPNRFINLYASTVEAFVLLHPMSCFVSSIGLHGGCFSVTAEPQASFIRTPSAASPLSARSAYARSPDTFAGRPGLAATLRSVLLRLFPLYVYTYNFAPNLYSNINYEAHDYLAFVV